MTSYVDLSEGGKKGEKGTIVGTRSDWLKARMTSWDCPLPTDTIANTISLKWSHTEIENG